MKTAMLVGAAALAAAAGSVSAQVVVWDNGASTQVTFNGAATYLGYSSGNVAAGLEQRFAAQAFSIPAGFTSISQIDASWFPSAGSEGATVNYRIWRRTAMTSAPTAADELSSGTLGAFVSAGSDDPRIPGTDTYLHQYSGLSIPVTAGDYWLTIYGAGGTNATQFLNWLTGAPGVDAQVTYNDFMWRSSNYGASGFAQYTGGGAVQVGPGMTDPTDRWNTSFVVYAVPAPSAAALLGLGGLVVARRRR
jgi:hypothetical protein